MFYSVIVTSIRGYGTAKLTIVFRMSMPFTLTFDAQSLLISALLKEVRPPEWLWNLQAREEAGDDELRFHSIFT